MKLVKDSAEMPWRDEKKERCSLEILSVKKEERSKIKFNLQC